MGIRYFTISQIYKGPIPVAAWSMEWVCGHSLVGIVGSNPARGINGIRYFTKSQIYKGPIAVTAWSMECVCGHSLVGIVGSNPARGMDVCLM